MKRAGSSLLAIVFGAMAPGLAAAETMLADAGCALTPGETGTVVAVPDAVTIELDAGLTVRLAGIAPPAALGGEAPPQQATAAMRQLLAELTLGKAVQLRYGEARRDRYERATAHVFVTDPAEEVWIQAALLDDGVAQVAGFSDARECLAALLGHERAARNAHRGLWRERHYRPLWAGDPSLRRADGLYGQVEGRVESVGATQRTIFLNFGRAWSHDLTVMVRAGDAEKSGVGIEALTALAGRRVRVRGWVTQRDGPLIRVDHPEQIEVLEEGNDGGQSEDRPDG